MDQQKAEKNCKYVSVAPLTVGELSIYLLMANIDLKENMTLLVEGEVGSVVVVVCVKGTTDPKSKKRGG